jgi:drug/metabolite transporter (DMT)-like permease
MQLCRKLSPTAIPGAGVFGAWIAHERPSRTFWWSATFGSAVVVGFAFWQGGGRPQLADGLLAVAAISAAIGYAEQAPRATLGVGK